MAIATYSDLQTAIANFLARTDLTSQIPDFIKLAESRMSRELETRSQEKRVQATLTSGDEYSWRFWMQMGMSAFRTSDFCPLQSIAKSCYFGNVVGG